MKKKTENKEQRRAKLRLLWRFLMGSKRFFAVSIIAALVTFTLSSLSMGVPSNGGIGPWQWSVIFALGLYGLARNEALAFANLVMGCQTLLLIALGVFTFACIAIQGKRRNKTDNNTKHDITCQK